MRFLSFGLLAGLALTVPGVLAERGATAGRGPNDGQGLGAGQEARANQTDNAAAQELANEAQALNGSAVAGDASSITLDPNNLQGSVLNNIELLMLSMGICNFEISSLSGLRIDQDIQLLLQLQQLQQLQALGIVNAGTVQGFLQQELLVNNFSLGILRRQVDQLVRKRAGKRRSYIFRKRQCASAVAGAPADGAAAARQ